MPLDFTALLRDYIHIKLEDLRGYIATVNDALTHEFHKFDEWVAQQPDALDPETAQEFHDFHSDTAWDLADRFPMMARHSSFVSAYFLLEHQLIAICKHQRHKQNIELEMNDLRHTGVHAAKVYLKKVCAIDFPDQTAEWQRITTYNKIRNFIVHNDAQLDKSNNADAIRAYAQGNNAIEIDGMGYIKLSHEFCVETIDTINAFFTSLLDRL